MSSCPQAEPRRAHARSPWTEHGGFSVTKRVWGRLETEGFLPSGLCAGSFYYFESVHLASVPWGRGQPGCGCPARPTHGAMGPRQVATLLGTHLCIFMKVTLVPAFQRDRSG